MNYKTLYSAVLLPFVVAAQAEATEPTIKISPQSIECHYSIPATEPNEQNKTRCTVRLHVTTSKGATLRTQDCTPALTLTATDGNGESMSGHFTEWELCFDSKENCHILAFDFDRLPGGGVLKFDTALELPVTPGIQKHEAPTFSTKSKTECTIANHQVEIEPLEKSKAAPDELVLRIIYTGASQVPEIIICDDEGYHLKSNIIDADYDEENDKTTAVYVQKYTKKTGKIALRTYQPTVQVKASVKFQATIGRNAE